MRKSRTYFALFTVLFCLSSIGFGQSAVKYDLQPELACYQSLQGRTVGANLTQDGGIITPATRGGRIGFYIFSKNTSYFQSPPDGDFQFQIPGFQKNFIRYRSPTSIVNIPSPSEFDLVPSQFVPLELTPDGFDSEAKKALWGDLIARISSAKNHFDGLAKFESDRRRAPPTQDSYLKALDGCSQVSNQSVKNAIAAEKAKFSVFSAAAPKTNDKQRVVK